MKSGILFFILLLTTAAFGQIQDYDFSIEYTYASPIGTMNKNITRGNGFTMDFYVTPEKINQCPLGCTSVWCSTYLIKA